eukprot:8204908-Pyramimonas_sp.AAC.1
MGEEGGAGRKVRDDPREALTTDALVEGIPNIAGPQPPLGGRGGVRKGTEKQMGDENEAMSQIQKGGRAREEGHA